MLHFQTAIGINQLKHLLRRIDQKIYNLNIFIDRGIAFAL